jgi:GNAT superfamily N-acetyltransferase
MTVELRELRRTDLEALLAIQRATNHVALDRVALEAHLFDPARNGGQNARVAVRAGNVEGVAGWVDAEGVQFGAPVLVADEEVGRALLAHLIGHARGRRAAWLRVGCADREVAKRSALDASGFRVVFWFVILRCEASPRDVVPTELRHVPIADVPTEVVKELHDTTFLDVDNAPRVPLAEVRHLQDHAWPDASGVWFAGTEPAAFVHAIRHGDIVDLADIGVAEKFRKRGLARMLVDRTIAAAAAAGAREVESLVASTNAASLALHRAAGFTERWRRSMLQLDL